MGSVGLTKVCALEKCVCSIGLTRACVLEKCVGSVEQTTLLPEMSYSVPACWVGGKRLYCGNCEFCMGTLTLGPGVNIGLY